MPTGYLIGRALKPGDGAGPWWQYVATLASYTEACAVARALAKEGGVRAWLHKTGDDYELLPDQDEKPWTGTERRKNA